MSYANLQRDLKGDNIPSLYLLYGEEGYFLEKGLRLVLDTLCPPENRDFNFDTFSGRELLADKVLDIANTLPLFATRRLVLIKETQNIPAAQLDRLLPYLQHPAPETVMVFVADKIDGRKKFFQVLKKQGEAYEFKRLYDNQLPGFVKGLCRDAGRTITDEGLRLFCRRLGSNLQEIQAEFQKLQLYMGERDPIDKEDVATVVADTRVDSVFDLTNALGTGQHNKALRLLRRLLAEGVAPLVILAMLVRHFRQLWKVKELMEQGTSRKDLPRIIGINPYFLDGLLEQYARFEGKSYRQMFELFLTTDLALKSSGAHPEVLLEKLLFDVAALSRRK